jgi:hypothetical protein
LWLNLGDLYCGSKPPQGLKQKDLVGIPWRVALALQADGWYFRQDIIWHKPNVTPESANDRCTKAHEYLFLMTKDERYYFDAFAIREKVGIPTRRAAKFRGGCHVGGETNNSVDFSGHEVFKYKQKSLSGRNPRSVWSVAIEPFSGAHRSTYPPRLVEPCVLAGTSERGCCPKCETQWRRIVTRHEIKRTRLSDPVSQTVVADPWYDVPVKTIGFEPSCECFGKQIKYRSKINGSEVTEYRYVPEGEQPEPIPSTVFDPFGGSGTTCLVAKKFRRNWLMIELNPDYAEIARKRIDAFTDVMLF